MRIWRRCGGRINRAVFLLPRLMNRPSDEFDPDYEKGNPAPAVDGDIRAALSL